MRSEVQLTVYDEVPPEAARVNAGLDSFNVAAAPLDEVRPLVALLHTEDNQVRSLEFGYNLFYL